MRKTLVLPNSDLQAWCDINHSIGAAVNDTLKKIQEFQNKAKDAELSGNSQEAEQLLKMAEEENKKLLALVRLP